MAGEMENGRPAAPECPCADLQRLQSAVFRLQRQRKSPTMKEHQRALSTIDHLLEENRELRMRLAHELHARR